MNRIFIIGTGPTMADVDLSLLKEEDTIALNDITHRLHKFTPTYWMFFDNGFYRPYMKTLKEYQSKGTKLVTLASEIEGAEIVIVTGCNSKLRQGKIHFSDSRNGILYSCGAIGYAALQFAWQKGYRELYVMGFDSRDPRPKEHYHEKYSEKSTHNDDKPCPPLGIWGKAYDYANKWIWENGGEIWDVSHSQCGSFPYKDLNEVLNA